MLSATITQHIVAVVMVGGGVLCPQQSNMICNMPASLRAQQPTSVHDCIAHQHAAELSVGASMSGR
jgi:hypothetical protein